MKSHREDEATVPLRGRLQGGQEKEEEEKEEKEPESAEAKAERMEALLDKIFNKEAPCGTLFKGCDKTTYVCG
jgi:hypothetical protein